MNPPGPNGEEEENFNPTLFGVSPVYGEIEIDVDGPQSGGDLNHPWRTSTGVVGRFGGHCQDSILASRSADQLLEVVQDLGVTAPTALFTANPQVKYSGHDFLLRLDPDAITSVTESIDESTGLKTWELTGRFFCRAPGYAEFDELWAGYSTEERTYCPTSKLLMKQAASTADHHYPTTTISLVSPLNRQNRAEQPDFDEENDNSVWEALADLEVAAT